MSSTTSIFRMDPSFSGMLCRLPETGRLKEQATQAGIPAIYVNDNFGQWRSEASKLVEIVCGRKPLADGSWKTSDRTRKTTSC